MQEPDPLQEMINQLNDMVRLVQKKKLDFSDKPLPSGIDEMLDDLETQVNLFTSITEETLQDLGLSKETIQQRLDSPPKSMKVEEKRKIRQLGHLKKDADEIKWLLSSVARAAKASKSEPTTQKGKKVKRAKKHKKRYKRLGGDDKWKVV